MKKKILVMLMSAVMVLTFIPAASVAAESDTTPTHKCTVCGSDLTEFTSYSQYDENQHYVNFKCNNVNCSAGTFNMLENHTWGDPYDYVNTDNSIHTYKVTCTLCGKTLIVKEACSYKELDKTEEGNHRIAKKETGEIDGTHEYKTVCEKCGDIKWVEEDCDYCPESATQIISSDGVTDQDKHYAVYKCSVCGQTVEGEEYHYYYKTAFENKDAATHTATYSCQCGLSYTEDEGHDYISKYTDLGNGTHQRTTTCADECGYKVEQIEDHDMTNFVIKDATIFAKGEEEIACIDGCGYVEGTVETAKLKYAAPTVKAGKNKITVTVKKQTDAVKYQVLVNGKVKKTVSKAGKVTIKNLTGGKNVKVRIRAIDESGNKALSKVKTIKVKK